MYCFGPKVLVQRVRITVLHVWGICFEMGTLLENAEFLMWILRHSIVQGWMQTDFSPYFPRFISLARFRF